MVFTKLECFLTGASGQNGMERLVKMPKFGCHLLESFCGDHKAKSEDYSSNGEQSQIISALRSVLRNPIRTLSMLMHCFLTLDARILEIIITYLWFSFETA